MNIKKIDKLINDLKQEIRKEQAYNGKRWKRSLSNQPGVYDVRLNFQQIMILDDALQQRKGRKDTIMGLPYPVHLKQKWNIMAEEIFQDFAGRMEKQEEIGREAERNFKDGQWSAEICESNLNKRKEEEKTT